MSQSFRNEVFATHLPTMRVLRAFKRVPRFTLILWFKIGVIATIVCLILAIPLSFFPRGSLDPEENVVYGQDRTLRAQRFQRPRPHHNQLNDDQQVESPEGNAFDHGSEKDKEHQQQIAIPVPHDPNDVVPAVIDQPGDDYHHNPKLRRNIPAPRKKPLPIDRAQPLEVDKVSGDDDNKKVVRPPPNPLKMRKKYEENEIRDDEATENSLKIPMFQENRLGNFELTEAKRVGLGENGVAVHLSGQEKKEAAAGNHEYGFNQIASEKISLDRSIPDTRPAECKHWDYPTKLPKVSVVIAFHNEMSSTLLRTVHSVINRTPSQLLEEVLMVDDFSDKEPLKKALEKYIERFNGKVRLIRNAEREGLIRTRSIGAKNAKGEVVFFLDAHCEVGTNWLPPLLAPIARDRTIMTVPVIDGIDSETYAIQPQYQGKLFRGIFEWGLLYKETELPEKEVNRRQRTSEPYKSPTHAGGLFAINREYFLELGGYDDGLLIWGGEQYELSFKIWQCGGSIELRQLEDRMATQTAYKYPSNIVLDEYAENSMGFVVNLQWVPCSHIGHIYRGFMPYGFGKLANKGPIVSLNLKRVAEVWMDEYKEYYYVREPLVRDLDEGDLSQQKALRQRLNCKSFDWYMKNVAYDVTDEFPVLPPNLFWGELQSVTDTWQCWDSRHDVPAKVDVSPCHHSGGHQLIRLNEKGQMGIGERCVEVDNDERVELITCPKGRVDGSWEYLNATQQVRYKKSGKCAEERNSQLFLADCDSQHGTSSKQKWHFQRIKAR